MGRSVRRRIGANVERTARSSEAIRWPWAHVIVGAALLLVIVTFLEPIVARYAWDHISRSQYYEIGYMVSALVAVVFAAALMWASRTPLSAIGWRTNRVSGQIEIGLVAAIAGHVAVLAFMAAFDRLARLVMDDPAAAAGAAALAEDEESHYSIALALIAITVWAIVTEVVYRGMLLSALYRLFGSMAFAVFFSTVAFTAVHASGGPVDVAWAGVLGLILAAVRVLSNSLLATIVCHVAIACSYFVLWVGPP